MGRRTLNLIPPLGSGTESSGWSGAPQSVHEVVASWLYWVTGKWYKHFVLFPGHATIIKGERIGFIGGGTLEFTSIKPHYFNAKSEPRELLSSHKISQQSGGLGLSRPLSSLMPDYHTPPLVHLREISRLCKVVHSWLQYWVKLVKP